jgi:hypothetical protein
MKKTEQIKKAQDMVALLWQEAAEQRPDQLAKVERLGAALMHAVENAPPRLLEILSEMETEGYSALTHEKLAEMREIMRRLTLDLHTGPTHG